MNEKQKIIYESLLEDICSGSLKVGDSLPTEVELSRQFSAKRMNAHLAVKLLAEKEVVWRNKRRGTVVKRIPKAYELTELKSVIRKRVAVVLSDWNDFYHIHWNSRTLSGLESVLNQRDIELVSETAPRMSTREEMAEFYKRLASEGVFGLILLSGFDEAVFNNLDLLYQYHKNVLVFEKGKRPLSEWPFRAVGINYFDEGCQAAEYLISQGFDDIVFACYSEFGETHWVRQRERGLRYGLRRFSENTVELRRWEFYMADFGTRVCDLLQRQSGSPPVIVTQNDHAAADLTEAAAARKLVPGRDFALLTFGDDVKNKNREFTSIAPPREKIGRVIGELLLDSVENDLVDLKQILVNSEFIAGQTCLKENK